MVTKIVKVPTNEAYPFCKRFFFALFGTHFECFGDCIAQSGWVGYPYYQKEDPDPILILFARRNDELQKCYSEYNNSGYKLKIIITDVPNDLEADEIIDLTDFEKYFQTELSLKDFINKIFE